MTTIKFGRERQGSANVAASRWRRPRTQRYKHKHTRAHSQLRCYGLAREESQSLLASSVRSLSLSLLCRRKKTKVFLKVVSFEKKEKKKKKGSKVLARGIHLFISWRVIMKPQGKELRTPLERDNRNLCFRTESFLEYFPLPSTL